MAEQNIIEINQLDLERYGKKFLANVTFRLPFGSQLLLTGPAGCGKTSLGLAICGQLYAHGLIETNYDNNSPYLPEARFISQVYEFKNRSGLKEFYYQQRYNSYDSQDALSVKEVLYLANTPSGLIDSLVKMLNMQHRLDACLIQLSSGERKKLQLIQELVNPAQIMIIDNPYIGLDNASQNNLDKIIAELAQSGITFIIIADANNIPGFITHVAIIENTSLRIIPKENYMPTKASLLPSNNFVEITKMQEVNHKFKEIIRFNKVSINYGNTKVLDNVDWLVQKGEKWLLAGHNGAGKSTILSLVNGDHPQAYANDFYLFDQKRGSGETIWEIKEKIGFVSPEFHWNFNSALTCFDAVLSGFFDTPGLYAKASEQKKLIATNWIKQFGLSGFNHERFANVSMGIQRMILLIRALVKNPVLFIFDEPCQGLDDAKTKQFIDLIDNLFADSNHTILYVSHRPDQIPGCLTNILEIERGRVLKDEKL